MPKKIDSFFASPRASNSPTSGLTVTTSYGTGIASLPGTDSSSLSGSYSGSSSGEGAAYSGSSSGEVTAADIKAASLWGVPEILKPTNTAGGEVARRVAAFGVWRQEGEAAKTADPAESHRSLKIRT